MPFLFFFSSLSVSCTAHILLFFFPFIILSFSFSFSLFFSLFLYFLLSFYLFSPHLTHRIFDFLQVRGSFLSLYYSSYHVSPFLWSMCHMDTCSRWHSPNHMALMPCVLLPCCHVAALGHAMCHNTMCHLTPGASKNVKFRPSRNSMLKSVLSFEI